MMIEKGAVFVVSHLYSIHAKLISWIVRIFLEKSATIKPSWLFHSLHIKNILYEKQSKFLVWTSYEKKRHNS